MQRVWLSLKRKLVPQDPLVDDVEVLFTRGDYKKVLKHLRENSKYPQNFDYKRASAKLKKFLNTSVEMADRVQNEHEDSKDLKFFLKMKKKENPKLIYFYDSENCSLIRKALEAKKFKIVKFLWQIGLKLAPHECIWNISSWNLTDDNEFNKMLVCEIFDNFAERSLSEIIKFEEFRGYNVLMLAVEYGRTDIVKHCIEEKFFKREIDKEFNGFTAASLAVSYKHYDILLIILKANAKFPYNFNPNDENLTEELKSFAKLTNLVHEYIESGDILRLERILKDCQDLDFLYDMRNNSALCYAIELKNFEICKILFKYNKSIGFHEDYDKILGKLNECEKEKLTDMKSEFKTPLSIPEILILMTHSYNTRRTKVENQEIEMLKAYNLLFKIPRVQYLLKIIAKQEKFEIIFDFERDTVQHMDPSSPTSARGVIYLSDEMNTIYIAAVKIFNETQRLEVIASLAHELCHYALHIIFKNSGRPYHVYDEEKRNEFEKIIRDCKNLKNKEEIVKLVYTEYQNTLNKRAAELIVRVVHMDVLYHGQEELKQKQKIFKHLYSFYDKYCTEEFKKIIDCDDLGIK